MRKCHHIIQVLLRMEEVKVSKEILLLNFNK